VYSGVATLFAGGEMEKIVSGSVWSQPLSSALRVALPVLLNYLLAATQALDILKILRYLPRIISIKTLGVCTSRLQGHRSLFRTVR